MGETADTIYTTVLTPQPESESSKKRSSDATSPKVEAEPEKKHGGSTMLSVWPPTQLSRDYLLNMLINILSKDSCLSKRYGTLNPEEASALAKSIEEDAYVVGSNLVSSDGIKNLEAYTEEISYRINKCAKDQWKKKMNARCSSVPELEEA
ncbi:PREDICTED: WPP domain-containing protein 3-like [Camelina sativa]|uniref:WPP domain-containing protein 3-like n=1 Tax=Camelina sativa TaxID=90675 RepID=A0ABM0VIL6_CAMSA|nr:PREDICTED: WPP domain-containing protein 3-like [Camelina sativa]